MNLITLRVANGLVAILLVAGVVAPVTASADLWYDGGYDSGLYGGGYDGGLYGGGYDGGYYDGGYDGNIYGGGYDDGYLGGGYDSGFYDAGYDSGWYDAGASNDWYDAGSVDWYDAGYSDWYDDWDDDYYGSYGGGYSTGGGYSIGGKPYMPTYSTGCYGCGASYPVSYSYPKVSTGYPVTISAPKHSAPAPSAPVSVVNNNTNNNSNVNINNVSATAIAIAPAPQPQVVYTPAPPVYTPPTNPYVSLTQIPYTGFDLGPIGNTMYWVGLAVLAIGGAYLAVYYIPQLAFATRSSRTLAPVVPEKAPILVEKENAIVADMRTRGVKDTMAIVDAKDGSMPKIVIQRS